MTSPCSVLVEYMPVRSGSCVCLFSMYVQNLLAAHAFAVVGLHSLPSVFDYFFGSPFFYGLPHLGAGPCLMVGFAFLQPTFFFSATISCHAIPSFLLRSCLPQSYWAFLGLLFILLPMAQYGHWFFYYITGRLLCPICFLLSVPGPVVFLGLSWPFS